MTADGEPDYVNKGQKLQSAGGDRFEVGRKLGGGKFGQVFEAKYEKKNGEVKGIVALKLIKFDEEDDSEVRNELNILKIVQNVERVVTPKKAFDVELNSEIYKIIVFERLGPSLEFLIQNRTLNVQNCVKIGYILLEIFEDLQKLGIHYKDLHSGNVLFSSDLRIMKLTDFGLSQRAKRSSKNDPKEYKYAFDASSIMFLMVCLRTDCKFITKCECSTSDYLNELNGLRDTLLDSNMVFLMTFLNEMIAQLKGELSYSKLRLSLTSELATFDPNSCFILTPTVPVWLA
ncbi:hypothetical protein B9Z55_022125 [Caenorhabditis nigoni]|uniref:Protein kinase domain-containing protein n=1 Tax=Caenorhabditis nigoni TaxID=1611254 RepID=A0A2G5TUY8_9PELO|nr:hypothetical protein B9Z55_022125 [Caenorhabditis nigoni]